MAATVTKDERVRRARQFSKAMSHRVRSEALIHLLSRGVSSPSEIAKAIGEDVSNVAYHVGKLVDFDCAEPVDEVIVRGSAVKHRYRATCRHMIDTGELLGGEGFDHVRWLIECFQPVVGDFNRAIVGGTLGDEEDQNFVLTRVPLKGVDAQGYAELRVLHEKLFKFTFRVERAAARRLSESGETPIQATSFQGLFEVPGF